MRNIEWIQNSKFWEQKYADFWNFPDKKLRLIWKEIHLITKFFFF